MSVVPRLPGLVQVQQVREVFRQALRVQVLQARPALIAFAGDEALEGAFVAGLEALHLDRGVPETKAGEGGLDLVLER